MFSVVVEPSARRTLRKLDARTRERLLMAIELLGQDPRPPASRPLVGRDAWRVRIGDYRIIYEIQDDVLKVVVVTLGHRREVYERWQGRG